MTADFDQPDDCFAHPRLAAVYDIIDGRRDDLDLYIGATVEFEVRTVLDVGCGTGSLSSALAARGIDVIGLDPASASLAVAQTKPHAERVRWIHGTVDDLPATVQADLAVMTGNVAQVFITDDQWQSTLTAVAAALIPTGRLIFETRIPGVRAWESWTPDRTRRRHDLPTRETVEYWLELIDVALPLVTFRSHYHFRPDNSVLTSDSTLRFRTEAELRADLAATGFVVDEIRDAPDRPGKEMVFVASTRSS